ncbi:MAG: DEAD/DEAH box helicase [Butyrivibrio sp.]|nr:DEAD/DEAH box helicase [Butyrivibrio sp.]
MKISERCGETPGKYIAHKSVENQATDRAHRIGQKTVVTAYRLIMKDTIEERIIYLQNKKNEHADELLNEGNLGTAAFTKEQLRELLG